MMTSKIHENLICQMWLGEMCNLEYGCNICKDGIKEKKVQHKITPNMNFGLFACEDIEDGEYIVQYKGCLLKNKPRIMNEYIIEINCLNQSKQNTKIYVDTKNSKSMAKYCNHSCLNNAKIAKVIKSKNSRDELWVKDIKDINSDEGCLNCLVVVV